MHWNKMWARKMAADGGFQCAPRHGDDARRRGHQLIRGYRRRLPGGHLSFETTLPDGPLRRAPSPTI